MRMASSSRWKKVALNFWTQQIVTALQPTLIGYRPGLLPGSWNSTNYVINRRKEFRLLLTGQTLSRSTPGSEYGCWTKNDAGHALQTMPSKKFAAAAGWGGSASQNQTGLFIIDDYCCTLIKKIPRAEFIHIPWMSQNKWQINSHCLSPASAA